MNKITKKEKELPLKGQLFISNSNFGLFPFFVDGDTSIRITYIDTDS